MDKPTPDLSSYIVGWKAWRITEEGNLCSHAYFCLWEPREPMLAICKADNYSNIHRPPKTDIPLQRCSCGIYAAKSLQELKFAIKPFETNAVIGKVALWGKVIEYSSGWRAEYAYPLSFYRPGRLKWLRWRLNKKIKRLRENFGLKE